MRRIVSALLIAHAAVVPVADAETEGTSFRNVALGEPLPNPSLPRLDGRGTLPLLGSARANVFVFFRPSDRSAKTLRELATLEREFEGKPVRFVAVTSDAYDRNDVLAMVRDTGIRMPVLVDVGDALYGALGVRLHPVVGIGDARGRLGAYQHFREINMLDIVRGRIRVMLGEIGPAEMAAIIDPPRADDGGATASARSRVKLAEILLAHGNAVQAVANARAALALAPGLAPAHAVLAAALAASGQCDEAARERAEAVRLDPQGVGARPAVACAPR